MGADVNLSQRMCSVTLSGGIARFLGATKHLYMRVRPFIRRSVTPSLFRRFRHALEHHVASIGSCSAIKEANRQTVARGTSPGESERARKSRDEFVGDVYFSRNAPGNDEGTLFCLNIKHHWLY